MADAEPPVAGRSPPRKKGSAQGLRPGRVVAGRYRIHQLLGKGSMGEVYRADDLSLGEYVALKFARGEGQDSGVLWRLGTEVKLAKRVSHPNVCRVHELGSFGDRAFVAMQLLEGETLERILGRNVGELSGEEKANIAHDLCAGLAAIHDKEILHCDLKPANVFVDPRGRAVITDFGLATQARAVLGTRSGTPAYMAPEVLAGKAPSQRSDLYSLGLVLFELFAGRPAFEAASKEELAALQAQGPPVFPAETGSPMVREAILRCLEVDPENRAASAERVAAMLPERRLAKSASAEWVVPPETLLVAPRLGLRPSTARWLALAALAGLAVAGELGSRLPLPRTLARGHPPLVLEAKAREHLATAGVDTPPIETRSGFALAAVRGERTPREPSVVYWYRQSPTRSRPRISWNPSPRHRGPAVSSPETAIVEVDLRGRLRHFERGAPRAGAPPEGASPAHSRAPDWSPLFAAAGLAADRFREVSPSRLPSSYGDRLIAWQRPPGVGETPLRVEAASLGARPVSFRVEDETGLLVETGSAEDIGEAGPRAAGLSASSARLVFKLWFWAVLAGAVYLARHHLNRGVADRKAAFRLALIVFGSGLAIWVLGEERADLLELDAFVANAGRSLWDAALVWILYVAFEPQARRIWPERVASWVRLLYGRGRDPLVGRDLLVGCASGIAVVVLAQAYGMLVGLEGSTSPRPEAFVSALRHQGYDELYLYLEGLRGLRHAAAIEGLATIDAAGLAFGGVVGVALLALLVKRRLAHRSAALLLCALLTYPASGNLVMDLAMALGVAGLWLLVLLRFGFLAAVVSTAVTRLLLSHPLTLDLSAWFSPGSTLALLSILALVACGTWAALGGQPVVPAGLWNGPHPDSPRKSPPE